VFSVVTAAVMGCGLVASAGAATGATSATASHRAAAAATAGSSWGTAEEVPGSAAPNADVYAVVNSVSCASAGNCTLTASQLRPGTHTLVAAYPGGSDFTSSASAKKTLTVVK
jgi:hypothetical protein